VKWTVNIPKNVLEGECKKNLAIERVVEEGAEEGGGGGVIIVRRCYNQVTGPWRYQASGMRDFPVVGSNEARDDVVKEVGGRSES
jgi:hypothetical protein